MDIQEYIESGILEQYALGELNEAERAAVEAQAAAHPEIAHELDQVQQAIGVYAQAHAETPPAAMRERVLSGWQAAIRSEAQKAPHTDNAAAPAAATEPVVRQLTPLEPETANTASGPAFRWMLAASVALLLASGLANFVLYTRWRDATADLAIARTEQNRVASVMQASERTLAVRQQELEVLRSDDFRTVALAGTAAAPSASARVLYNPKTKAVYLDVRKLPAPPSGKQYQLWALDNGKPVDAGVLAAATTSGDSLQQMKDIASAQAFAMTVEPAGGSINPTLSTLTVVGNI
ncbi:anti-sigma factor domain-containing protein [Hymenobacter sp. HDW8]|uniref:anti-sigma factor n=1 Tax=Hymenobacter sp. HDW8 TaxID=2714932 RepID=UPI00140E0318|nr:anti-sigma factor [Hymenobacter sp. HDW8]QIL74433.1 anti-sigma factor [Hymenobacter sp. HDW8]